MTIAYLINQYPQASQSFIRREIAGLEALGVRVERFTIRRWKTELVDEADRAERERTRCVLEAGMLQLLLAAEDVSSPAFKIYDGIGGGHAVGLELGPGMIYHLVYLIEACVLLGWLESCGAEHVHAHFGTNSTMVAQLCRLLGGPPYSFTVHGPEEFDRPMALKLRQKIASAQFVVAISEFGRSQLYRWCDQEYWSKIHVVHCGVDQIFAPNASEKDDLPPRLVCVGRLAAQKGQLLLVEAVGRLVAQGMKFELLLVGDGELRPEIVTLIGRLGLEKTIRLSGWLSNAQVRQEILASRALVVPSFAEGLPVVIMEALALHRPVISTWVAGIPELVENGVSGFLIPPGSVEALAQAMGRVLEADSAQLRRMGQAGVARVAQCHNSAAEAAKLAQLLGASAPAGAPVGPVYPPGFAATGVISTKPSTFTPLT